jgi:hypothetical protein
MIRTTIVAAASAALCASLGATLTTCALAATIPWVGWLAWRTVSDEP